ncbi:MAG: hypothetical protein JWN23_1553 [Rhodocyclales bacterium]|nr:hypothetical protein [Rhodocyclales bacterium]
MKLFSRFFSARTPSPVKDEPVHIVNIPVIRKGMWCVDLDTNEICIPTSITTLGDIVVDYAHAEDGTYVRTTARPITKLRQATHAEIPASRRPEVPMTHLGY